MAGDTNQTPVTFKCKNLTLTGRLILPDTKEIVPVIVYIEGSGPNSPLDTARRSWYKTHFDDCLLKHNIGILYYNKRGIGGSEGKWYTADFFDRAEETKAAVDFLKQHPAVDSANIGVLGHSQGGWIAQLAAALYPGDVKFAVSVCGPTFSVFKQIVNDYQSEDVLKGMDSLTANKKAVSGTKRLFFYSSVFSVFSDNLKQIKRIKHYDPAPYLTRIKIPMLLVFGEYDLLVYPEWSLEALNKTFDNHIPENFTVYVAPQASHGLFIKPGKYKSVGENQIQYSEEFHEFYVNWILNQIKK
jgi:uncharacterized protein